MAKKEDFKVGTWIRIIHPQKDVFGKRGTVISNVSSTYVEVTIDDGKNLLMLPEELQIIASVLDEPVFAEKKNRKSFPVGTGVLDYFPDALLAVANVSFIGNEQHHPGQPLHWDRSKSTDEADALMRHFIERGKLDTDGTRHSAKVAWRALALLQKEIEAEKK